MNLYDVCDCGTVRVPEFPHYLCESTSPTSDDYNFPVRTLIPVFLDSTESSLSLEFNKMKCLTKPCAEQWAGLRKVEKGSILVSETSDFGTRLYLK